MPEPVEGDKDASQILKKHHENGVPIDPTLFRNKRCLVNLKTKRNASKFAIFMEKENPCSFFRFSFGATSSFTFINALVYVDIDQGIYKGKTQSCSK